jgi:hypothetical protein
LVWAFAASSSSAAPINLSARDWLSLGDGLLTYDASTGLEWLDLTYTKGQSIASGEALPFFDTTAASGRFRWATTAEIVDLLNEIPASATLVAGDWLNDTTPSTIASARAFIQLLGDTYGQPEDSVALGVSRGSPDPFNPGFSMSFVEGTDFGGIDPDFAQIATPGSGACCMGTGDSDPLVGLWLVRPAASVPEPVASTLLLALGLLGLHLCRRHRTIG